MHLRFVGPLNSHRSFIPAGRYQAESKWGGFKVFSFPLSSPEVIIAVTRSAFSGFFLSCCSSILLKYNRCMGVLWPQIYSNTAENKAESRETALLNKIKSGLKSGCFTNSRVLFLLGSNGEQWQILLCYSGARMCQLPWCLWNCLFQLYPSVSGGRICPF